MTQVTLATSGMKSSLPNGFRMLTQPGDLGTATLELKCSARADLVTVDSAGRLSDDYNSFMLSTCPIRLPTFVQDEKPSSFLILAVTGHTCNHRSFTSNLTLR